MLRQVLLGLAVASAFVAAPAFAQEVKMQLKFKEGDKFWVEEVANQKQKITVMGQDIQIDMKVTTIRSFTVQKVTSQDIVLAMKIEDVDVKSEGPLAAIFDQVTGKTKGASLVLTVTPAGKVKKVEGFGEFVKKLAGGEDETAKAMKDILSEDMLTQGVEQAFAFVPEKAVKPGDSWDQQTKFALGPLGSIQLKNNYTYKGKKEGGEEISDKLDMQFLPPKQGSAFAGAIVKMLKTDVKGDGKATFIFDVQKGRLANSTTSMQLQGTMTMEAGGMELQIEMLLNVNSTSRVLDKNPKGN
jgi:Family of unknown function (DUF6263)